jgi:hypothetical protein
MNLFLLKYLVVFISPFFLFLQQNLQNIVYFILKPQSWQ